MKIVTGVFGTLAGIAGFFLGIYAFWLPRNYYLSGASAVQITQVYSEASFYALISIAAFLFTMLLFLSATGYALPTSWGG